MKLVRELDPVEIRVLGSLLEKQQSTPEYYPLTGNALLAACNQRSSREPVMDLAMSDVVGALDRLRELVLVWSADGARSERWEHNLDARWDLDAASKAVLTLLFLRGEQTPGELRQRADRLHAFASPEEVEATLRRMAADGEPLVFELPRRPGHKEARWSHLAGGIPPGTEKAAPLVTSAAPESLERRVAKLEQSVLDLTELVAKLKAELGG